MKLSPSFSPLALAAGLLVAWQGPARADVRLPALISDNMVLQQNAPANVWGWAAPQEAVTVKLGPKEAKTAADADGKWNVKLEGIAAGDAGDMTITGKNTLTVKNVAVGEVWVASGQSNMEWTVSGAMNPAEEISAANFPKIRMFTVVKSPKAEPQADCTGKWEVCTPATAGHFSAVGYFFARNLEQNLQIPIGVIHSSWGGTPAELWTPPEVLAAETDFQAIIKGWEAVKANYPKAKAAHDEAMAKWKEESARLKAENKPVPRAPGAPRGGDDFGSPGCLYNGMIAPLLPYTIRGAIWYQGESNAGNAGLYQKLFPTMIRSWRERWNVGEFPFLFVQLANFKDRFDQPVDSQWAALREAQTRALELPHTGMAVAIEIGEAKDIHPKNKQEVGRRLALNALATVYFKEIDYSGPIISAAQGEEGKIRVTFRFADGLKTTDGGKPKGFALAGDDKKFRWANAEIEGDHVVLSSPEVPNPVAARYAWQDNPETNLVNGAGLPASPFRTDDWPQAQFTPKP
jgi:sialate O-acetylesterase